MPLHLGEEPLDGDGHQSHPPKAGHVAEHMRGVEPLLLDVEFEFLDQLLGYLVHDATGEFVIEEQITIAFKGAEAHLVDARPKVECVLDVGSEDVGINALLIVPVVGSLEKQKSGDGVEFLGGSSDPGMELFGEFGCGHEMEENVSKDALPTLANLFETQLWNNSFEEVEKVALLGIDGMAHVSHNFMTGIVL